MQALAYYIEMIQYEPLYMTTIEPPFSVAFEAPTTSKPAHDVPVEPNKPDELLIADVSTSRQTLTGKNIIIECNKHEALTVSSVLFRTTSRNVPRKWNFSNKFHIFSIFPFILSSDVDYGETNVEHHDSAATFHDRRSNAEAGDMVEPERHPIDHLQAILVDDDVGETNTELVKAVDNAGRPMDTMD